MIIKNSEFLTSAADKKGYPNSEMMEFAMAGRSNVGKSSFINKLLNRKNLARVSKTQGKTALINFFVINDEFMLVDLPGYGYARVSQTEQQRWGKMINAYLASRNQLKTVFLLLDIRHKPTAQDKIMFDYIVSNNFEPVIILTKADKLAKTKIEPEVEKFKEMFNITSVFPFSALNGYGRDEILDKIELLLQGGENNGD